MRTPFRNREVLRIEAFSDAVFGFAATLLVVSLEVPTSYKKLIDDLRGLPAFGITFGALVLLWSVHNGFFRRYSLQDARTVLINSILLFLILFFVFPLKSLAHLFFLKFFGLSAVGSQPVALTAEDLASIFMLYGAGFSAVFVCFALMYRHAYKMRAVLDLDEHAASEARFRARHYFIFVCVGIVSIAIAYLQIGIRFGLPGFVYCFIGPAAWLHGRAFKSPSAA
ncbi:MAG: TMEM175 family protein [Planctomycetota bacterium]